MYHFLEFLSPSNCICPRIAFAQITSPNSNSAHPSIVFSLCTPLHMHDEHYAGTQQQTKHILYISSERVFQAQTGKLNWKNSWKHGFLNTGPESKSKIVMFTLYFYSPSFPDQVKRFVTAVCRHLGSYVMRVLCNTVTGKLAWKFCPPDAFFKTKILQMGARFPD